MSLNPGVKRVGRTVFWLAIYVIVAAVASAGQGRKKSTLGSNPAPDDDVKPKLLNADTTPTLRYPVASFSGWSIKSTSYGWLDVTRDGIRYEVMQPSDKSAEGFEVSSGETTELKLEQAYLTFRRGAEKKKYSLYYLSQDRWGSIHNGRGSMQAADMGTSGTESIFSALRNFDSVLALVKPPAAAVAIHFFTPKPPPKPPPTPPPPAIVIASPSGAGANQIIEAQETPVVIRGVAMDNTGIPVVSINGAAANIRPQNSQAAEFWSDPLPLKAGANPILVSAGNTAKAETRVIFTINYTPRATQVNARGLDKASIISLLAGAVSPRRVAEIVRERGVKFRPTFEDMIEIRAAGGTNELIEAIRQSAPPR